MKMSIKQLRAFLAVAHTLNFAHASERLNMSQPALSLAIKGLEEMCIRDSQFGLERQQVWHLVGQQAKAIDHKDFLPRRFLA